MSNEILERIDAKLGAILALTLDSYLRETGAARPKPRSVDRLLADSGLNTGAIAKMLGKTDRAVQRQLQESVKEGHPHAGLVINDHLATAPSGG